MKRIAMTLALVAAIPLTAHAVEYSQVNNDDSAINFSYTQMGVTMEGSFRSFTSELNFDPTNPTAASAVIDVELGSISTGMAEADSEVAGKPWFNTAAFPTARFESASVTALGDNRFDVAGTLTIKGTTQQIVAPAGFTEINGAGVFDGSFTIRRGDFAIGEGAWSKFDILANDIHIQFRITATSGN